MWITANCRILARLMEDMKSEFDVKSYLQYTEMVGEPAVRLTWQSVLMFDDEYRQRQAKVGFPWMPLTWAPSC